MATCGKENTKAHFWGERMLDFGALWRKLSSGVRACRGRGGGEENERAKEASG